MASRRAALITGWSTVALAMVITQAAQTPVAAPAFDAASVKIAASADTRIRFDMPPGRLTAVNTPLRFLIRQAYRVPESRIVGGPDWIDSVRFDIAATSVSATTSDQLRLMLRTLLETRFQMAIGQVTREVPVYALRLARSDRTFGPNLQPSTQDCAGQRPQMVNGRVRCGVLVSQNAGSASLRGGGSPFAEFVRLLGDFVERPLVDDTGLGGVYDIDLQFTAERSGVPGAATPGGLAAAAGPDEIPALPTALREQLGLRLEAQRAPVDLLLIERVARPTEN